MILSLPTVSGYVLTFLVPALKSERLCFDRYFGYFGRSTGQPFRAALAQIFELVYESFFYVDDMKLFLPVRNFQDCLNIQSDLNRLVDWCGANSLKLNVGKCKSTIFSRLRHHVEFPYMLGGIILDRVDSITDLGVVMDSRMSFSGHIEVTVGKAMAMLGFVKRLTGEFRDPYSLRTLHV
jgi:hypothetical protein